MLKIKHTCLASVPCYQATCFLIRFYYKRGMNNISQVIKILNNIFYKWTLVLSVHFICYSNWSYHLRLLLSKRALTKTDISTKYKSLNLYMWVKVIYRNEVGSL